MFPLCAKQIQNMASIDVDVTFDDIATLCEESQDELADLLLQEEPFYSFIKSEPSEDFGNSTEAPVLLTGSCFTVIICFVDELCIVFLLFCDLHDGFN